MRKEEFYSIHGAPYSHQETLDFNDEDFYGTYYLISRKLEDVNSYFSEGGIDFSLLENWSFNAHARKLEEGYYLIALRSGIVDKVPFLLRENEDSFDLKVLSKSDAFDLAKITIWMQIFAHELGHVLKGHNDIARVSQFNIFDESTTHENEKETTAVPRFKDDEHFKMLLEIDADVFSGLFLGQLMVSWANGHFEENASDASEDIIDVVIKSLVTIFSYIAETGKITNNYPFALKRAEIVINNAMTYFNSHKSDDLCSDVDVTKVKKKVLNEAVRSILDKKLIEKGLNQESIDHWVIESAKAVDKYSRFSQEILPYAKFPTDEGIQTA
ncbi:conserved hypothetical protein [Vibrio chagasii]|nr:conserved hypothetical protein [Vibrio chagasii]CAH6959400.1 conserved hypothetical protein [Vibrio chagasii]CAH6962889.1 conserved hypothetical protein [Vibrio chagasii]CAH7158583.1 conserved hypothetical protein [Vibrio chagasii]CAH7238466.1 conserved hypothetical protein [Vibrio chagasii]